jgi:hypothetical protein
MDVPGVRAELVANVYELAGELGRCGELNARHLAEIFDRFSSHAAHEERFVHPLIRSKLGQAPFDIAIWKTRSRRSAGV